MSTSQALEPSSSTSKQEFSSSLLHWRRWLAMFNWRPVVDYELREIAFDLREQQLRIEDEQRQIAHEQRMKQLKNEIERLDELNSKINTLFPAPAPTRPHPGALPTAPRPDRVPSGIPAVGLRAAETIQLNQQAGVLLLLASLATLAGDVELETRRRHRPAIPRYPPLAHHI